LRRLQGLQPLPRRLPSPIIRVEFDLPGHLPEAYLTKRASSQASNTKPPRGLSAGRIEKT
jgi:hypothetical protein